MMSRINHHDNSSFSKTTNTSFTKKEKKTLEVLLPLTPWDKYRGPSVPYKRFVLEEGQSLQDIGLPMNAFMDSSQGVWIGKVHYGIRRHSNLNKFQQHQRRRYSNQKHQYNYAYFLSDSFYFPAQGQDLTMTVKSESQYPSNIVEGPLYLVQTQNYYTNYYDYANNGYWGEAPAAAVGAVNYFEPEDEGCYEEAEGGNYCYPNSGFVEDYGYFNYASQQQQQQQARSFNRASNKTKQPKETQPLKEFQQIPLAAPCAPNHQQWIQAVDFLIAQYFNSVVGEEEASNTTVASSNFYYTRECHAAKKEMGMRYSLSQPLLPVNLTLKATASTMPTMVAKFRFNIQYNPYNLYNPHDQVLKSVQLGAPQEQE